MIAVQYVLRYSSIIAVAVLKFSGNGMKSSWITGGGMLSGQDGAEELKIFGKLLVVGVGGFLIDRGYVHLQDKKRMKIVG